MMNSCKRYLFLFPLFMLVFQGCVGDGTQSDKKAAAPKDKIVSELKAGLIKSKEAIRDRDKEIEALRKQIDSLEYQASELKVRLADAGKATQTRSAPQSGEELEPSAKIGLMGAKAIAEFKASQLSQRVDKLSRELKARERELTAIKEGAPEKEKKLQELSEQIGRLQSAENTRVAELSKRLEKMGKNLSERAEETAQLRKSVQEKSSILDTFKTAIADCKKLKETAADQAAGLQAGTERMEDELAVAMKRIEESEEQVAQVTEEVEQCRLQGEKLRDQADRSQEENEKLQARIDRLEREPASSPPQTDTEPQSEPEAELEPESSNIDKILRVPQLEGASGSDRSMY